MVEEGPEKWPWKDKIFRLLDFLDLYKSRERRGRQRQTDRQTETDRNRARDRARKRDREIDTERDRES